MITSIEMKLDPSKNEMEKIDEIMLRNTRVIKRVLGILKYEAPNIYTQTKNGNYRTTRKILVSYMIRPKIPPLLN